MIGFCSSLEPRRTKNSSFSRRGLKKLVVISSIFACSGGTGSAASWGPTGASGSSVYDAPSGDTFQLSHLAEGAFQFTLLDGGEEMEFAGEIGEGVSEALQAFLRKNTKIKTVRLRSPGGRVAEANRMKTVIRGRGIDTQADDCSSSCVLAFLGGQNRYLTPQSRVGLHRFDAPESAVFEGNPDRSNRLVTELVREGVSSQFAKRANEHSGSDLWAPSQQSMITSRLATRVRLKSAPVRGQTQRFSYKPIFYAFEAVDAGNYARAMELLEPIGDQGNVFAQAFLAKGYQTGTGVEKDLNRAFYWFTRAAEQGDAASQNNLGIAYANGEGTEKNAATATTWIERAAENGDPPAQFNLAKRYFKGWGKPVDYSKAFGYFKLAADAGYNSAVEMVGYMLERGLGTTRNLVEACAWYTIAAKGSSRALSDAKVLSAKLSSAETFACHKLVRKFARPAM